MKTQELKRATHAWQKVNAILGDEKRSKEWRDKYASYASSLPATILNCGLGQAAATLLAASKKADNTSDYDPHFQLYKYLESWLCLESGAPYEGSQNLLNAICHGNRRTYIHAQAEALKWLEWLKKLAVAYLKKAEGGEK
jgi:CRISPR-associated protein Cmr5